MPRGFPSWAVFDRVSMDFPSTFDWFCNPQEPLKSMSFLQKFTWCRCRFFRLWSFDGVFCRLIWNIKFHTLDIKKLNTNTKYYKMISVMANILIRIRFLCFGNATCWRYRCFRRWTHFSCNCRIIWNINAYTFDISSDINEGIIMRLS